MRYLILLLLPFSVSAQPQIYCDQWGRCVVYENKPNYMNSFQQFGNQPSLGQRIQQRQYQQQLNEQLMLQNELLRRQLEQQR